MPGRPNSFERMAAEAAERIDQARAHGQQLSLLADAEPQAVAEGRAVRGKGKAVGQMREWLASRGYDLPQEQLARMAGLAGGADPVLAAMTTAERVLAWAYADKTDKDGNPVKPTAHAFMNAFEMAYGVQLRAADAMLPYIAAKVSPDGPQAPVVQVVVAGGPAAPVDRAAAARDVTPVQGGRMRSASATLDMQQNQQVSGSGLGQSDSVSRTERASD